MNPIDFFVQNYFVSLRTPQLTESLYLITLFFDGSIYFVLLVMCVAFLVYLVRNLKYSILFIFSIFSGTVIVLILKHLFNVARPTDSIAPVFGQSFPSFHATIATIFFVMLMYIFDSHFKKPARILFNVFCGFCILLVSFSRLYLGAHWLSDVVVGVLLGIVISLISIKIFHKKYKKRKNIHR